MMTRREAVEGKAPTFYNDNLEHLADELLKLDLLLRLRIQESRSRALSRQGLAADPKVYISHAEVDRLLCPDGSVETESAELAGIRQQLAQLRSEIDARVVGSTERGVFLALPRLAHLFALSPFELQTVVVCLAPELRRKYDKVYAYLQDDIARKKPSVDLVLDLLCRSESERWEARSLFSSQAPLFRAGILQATDDPYSPSGSSGLAQFLRLDERVLYFILGNNRVDSRLAGLVRLFLPSPEMQPALVEPALKTKALNLIHHHFSEPSVHGRKLVLHLQGPYGVGKRDVALEMCGELNCPLLSLDMELLLSHEADPETTLRLAFREGLLLQAAVYLDHVDVVLDSTRSPVLAKRLANVFSEYGWLVFLAGEKRWHLRGVLEGTAFQSIELALPDVPLRETAWTKALESLMPGVEASWAEPLARQFRLTPGQIQDAVEWAQNGRVMRGGQGEVTMADLLAACRQQSNQKLSELAIKIEPRYGWQDIVLPEDKLAQLGEICSQFKHHYRVFGKWGFEQKMSHGKGLSVLFSGPSGTGKTMAAEVIAHELQLDLYKIDLSGVVSKYVGETEKNLSRIFHEAETSNAVLFFDEADALFGKRTKVSDAHDRYANIETSYLLQRMEEYDGVVILATNLRENMDQAFTRRIRFIVEFPFPDAASRLEMWRTHFPRQAPVSKGIDYQRLSERLQVAGGNIRDIVLNAAFFAAQDGGRIGMEHVLCAARREYDKIGKLWDGQDLAS